MKLLLYNALIINEDRTFQGSVLIDGLFISQIFEGNTTPQNFPDAQLIDASGKWLLPGVIDDQVHFREPGLTHKGNIASESRAAVAGGTTTFMDMPNTLPQTTSLEALQWKLQRAAETSLANYAFFFGGTNHNAHLIKHLDPTCVPGVKLFLGASTGDMLVDDKHALHQFFNQQRFLVAVHAEDEKIIRTNRDYYISRFGDDLDVSFHPKIRDEQACYSSSSSAAKLARQLGTRLHIFHLSTARELELLDTGALNDRMVTGEVCTHHLWFCDDDYARLGNRIKWNPAIKSDNDRNALRNAVRDNIVSVIATDHAPHLLNEKQGSCLKAASGGPLIQHSLIALLELAAQGHFSKEQVVRMTAHNPAELYRIDRRGYIRNGYFADLVLIDPQPNTPLTVCKDNIFYKCGWSPFEGTTFRHSVSKTIVNGSIIYSNNQFCNNTPGMRVVFKAN